MKIIKIIVILLLILSAPGHTQSILKKYESGIRMLEQGETEKARTKFEEILEIRPYYYDAYVGIGRCYMQDGKEKEALENFEKALEVKPGWYDAHYHRAHLHFQYGRSRAALKDIEDCLAGRPGYVPAMLLKGNILRNEREYKQAIATLDKAIQIAEHRASPVLFIERAKSYAALDQHAEAIQDLGFAIEKGKVEDTLYHYRARLNVLAGDTNAALNDLDRFLGFHEDHTAARATRARLSFAIADFTSCINDLDYLIEDQRITDDPGLFELRGRAQLALKHYDPAIRDITRAIMGNRERTDLYLLRAEAYNIQGKENAALADYRRLIRFEANDPRPWIGLGKYYMSHKRWDKAIEELDEAIKIEPTAEGHYQRAICYYELRKDKEACEDLEAAAGLGHVKASERLGEFCR